MGKYLVYTSRETVKARQVTAKDGETIVTRRGPQYVPYGDYVTDDGCVFTSETFDALFKRRVVKKRKSAPTEPDVPVTQTTMSSAFTGTAAERVRAARAAKDK